MGKVLGTFTNGWPGATSRAVDEVIISMANGSGNDIPFGAPVFMIEGRNSCKPYASNVEAANFLGFTVRSGDKTPNTFGSDEAVFKSNDPVEILVRGAIVVQFGHAVDPGAVVYIRKSDGVLVTDPGSSGTTLELPNVRVKTASDIDNRAEVVVTERNLL